VFVCVYWAHIFDDFRKNLDEKSHSCIMMDYSEELKSYRLFDPIKQQIIISRNVRFDDKCYEINLLNASSRFPHDDPFDVFSKSSFPIPHFSHLTEQ
jgi:hypothetical protein